MAVAAKPSPKQNKSTDPPRDIVMISHANPEDDDLAIWLATQLANEGYKVWCDKVQFLAGEQFWTDIDKAIRVRAYKVIYILSRVSNELGLRGFTKELNLAMTIQRGLVKQHGAGSSHRRFVLPIAKDDLPTAEYNVHFIGGTNVLPFQSWASGFTMLRSVLKQDKTPKFKQNRPSIVKDWWNSYRSVSQGKQDKKHKVASNFFPLVSWPELLFIHTLNTEDSVDPDAPFPNYQKKGQLFSFATVPDLDGKLGPNISVAETQEIPVRKLLSKNCPAEYRQYRPDLVALLRICWEMYLEKRGDIRFYEMANRKRAAYFAKPSDMESLTHAFDLGGEFCGRRKLLSAFGGGTRKDGSTIPKRFYHFAIDARPIVVPFGLQLISHVIFTDDGNAPWESKSRMHTVRRSFCSQWYNDRWRDCLLAWVSYLAQSQTVVSLPVCSQAALELRCLPRLHTSFVIFEKVARTKPDDSAIEPSDDVEAASDLLDSEPGIDETEEDEEED